MAEQTMTIGERFAQATNAEREAGLSVEMRTLLDTTTAAGLLAGHTPVAPPVGPRRRYVRDLLGTPAPCGRIVRYVAEQVTAEAGGATSTDEGAAKAETSFRFDWGELTAGKVTAWAPITAEILEDAPGLAAWVNGRMAEQLASAEDDQLINGDGTAPNLTGFLSWGDILTQTAANNDPLTSLGEGIAQVEAQGTQVDGIVINPADYWAARLERRSTVMDSSVPFDAEGNIFGVPTIRTTKIAAGSALVGAFTIGATLRERSPVTVRVSDSHSTYFTANKVAVVAEVDEALTVSRPDYFASVALDTTA